MKNNIKYISNKNDMKLRKELSSLIDEKGIKRFNGLLYYFLLYVKYIIEKEKMNYYDIIDGNIDDLVKILKERFRGTFYNLCVKLFVDYKLYEILGNIAFVDYEIESYTDRVLDKIIDKDKRYLLISTYNIPYIKYDNVDILVDNIDVPVHLLDKYLLLDEITGIKREYPNSKKCIYNYDNIIYINDKNYVSFDTFLRIENKNIIMICNYSQITNIKNRINNIKRILLDKDKAYVEYHSNNKIISNKELSNVSDNELIDIINSKDEISIGSINKVYE